MRQLFPVLLVAAIVALVAGGVLHAQAQPLVFRNVTVIDGTGGAAGPGMTVVVTGNRITAVGRNVTAPQQARIIDATGKFLIPGLWDMHLHLRGESAVPRFRTFGEVLLVANGVTGARIMAGLPEFHKMRNAVHSGDALGPRTFISSRNMDGVIPRQPLPPPLGDAAAEAEEWRSVNLGEIPRAFQVTTATQAREAIAISRKSGVEFVKIHNELTPDAYFALATEAKGAGLYLTGHAPTGVSVAALSDSGMKSLEHFPGMLEGCSTREEELLKASLAAVSLSPAERNRRHAEIRRMAVDSFSAEKCAALATRLVKNGTWLSPTFMPEGGLRATSTRNADLARYVPAPLRARWQQQAAAAPEPVPPSREDQELAERVEARRKEIVGIMKRGGVQFVVGTDSGGAWRIPGRSLHEGLEEMNKAGLTPMEVIQAATSSSARLLRIDKEVGTIQAGKLADLVLLDANPLQQIANTRRINAVVLNGRLFDRKALDDLFVRLASPSAPASAQAANAAVPMPAVTGPVPVTADSYPFMASGKLQTIVDLPKLGYVEEEFFVSGRANVYDWAADGRLAVRTANAPYTTRILLRRPADPQRFSGNAIVEIANSARRFDFNFSWGVSHDYFIENGDAFVVITLAQPNLEGLKAFDAARYAPLSMANPTPDETCAVGRGGGAPQTSTFEPGLQWDILSQVGALLTAARAGGPLAGFDVQRVYMTAYDGIMATYMAAIHPNARLANGRPVYDGYIQHRHPGLASIRRCAPAPAADDPRQTLRTLDVPLIRIIPETDVLTLSRFRREDSDAPHDRYRLYEVAGGSHADGAFYPYMPPVADLKKIGSPYSYLASWPFHNQCDPEMLLMKTPINTYVLDAAFASLTRWVRDGVAPPRAERIRVENGGTPQARVVRDQFGNAIGGVRTPYLDVPAATYHTTSNGDTFCPELGRTEPFDWARLVSLYGTPQNYAARVAESVDRLVKDRWLTESDGRKIKADAIVRPVTSSASR